MKRLIHFPINEVLPIGGPAGYLSNLKRGLDEIGAHEYEFLPAEGVHFKKNKTLRRVVPKRLKDLRRLYKCINLPQVSKPAPVDYTQYRSIHFHSTLDLYTYRNALEAYKGNVILTSHSPCAAHKELLDSLDLHDVQRHAQELKRLAIIDEYAFKRADTIIFPCAEAEEPYFHTWNEYAQIRDSSKIRYLPTGICSPVIRESRSVIRKRYGIPDEAFLMCYIGRHNSIKGYDALVQATVPLLKKNNNYWMLVAGKEGPLYRPNQQHWVEAGWTNDPYSIIAAADVFILPNRETYFDLILLEVLALGQLAAITTTGGNKYFKQFSAPGIFYFDTAEELSTAITQIQHLSPKERKEVSDQNTALYTSNFTYSTFAQKYCSLMDSLR